MDKIAFYRALHNDPCRTHKDIVIHGGLDALRRFVRGMAVDYKLSLMLYPVRENEIAKWRIIAKMFLKEITDNSKDNVLNGWHPTENQGLFEMMPHFRNAHIMVREGKKIMRSGSIVRSDKLDNKTRNILTGIQGQYNEYAKDQAKKRKIAFMPIVTWLKHHPELYEEWLRVKDKRLVYAN